MKISEKLDGSKPIELGFAEDGNSKLGFQKNTSVTTESSDGVKNNVLVIGEFGDVAFSQRPSVLGIPVTLATDQEALLETISKSVVDNVTQTYPVCPVQEMVSILYTLQGSDVQEHGTLTVSKGSNSFFTDVTKQSRQDQFADIEFSAIEDNNSLVLVLSGHGQGKTLDFKYRVNTVNSLYI